MSTHMKRFAEKLRYLRKEQGLTLAELGSTLGVHNTYISQLEKERRVPNAEMILRISDYFQVSTDQLMRDELEVYELNAKIPTH